MMSEFRDTQSHALEQMHNEGPGRIDMAQEVIQTIAARETIEAEGVHLYAPKSSGSKFSIFSSSAKEQVRMQGLDKDLIRNVAVEVQENHVQRIDLTVEVEYGHNIYECCRALQRRIKNAVESMTGKIVDQVNIKVQGLITIQPEVSASEAAPEQIEVRRDSEAS